MVTLTRHFYSGLLWLLLLLLAACGEGGETAVSTSSTQAVSPTPLATFQPPQPTRQPLVTPTADLQTDEPVYAPSPTLSPTETTDLLTIPLPDEVFPTPDARISPLAPTIYQNYLYVPAGNQLIVFDISDPTNIKETGRRTLGGEIKKLLVDGQYAYALRNIPSYYGLWTAVLEILDIRDPTNLRSIYTYASATYRITDFTVVGQYAYIVEQRFGIRHSLNWLDIANPANPVQKGVFTPMFGGPNFFGASDEHIYFVHSQADRNKIRYEAYLEVFDTVKSESLDRVASYDFTTEIRDGYTWVTRYLTGQFDDSVYMIVLDPERVSNEDSPALVPKNQFYNLFVLDFADPSNPVELALFNDVNYRMKMLTQTIGYASGECLQFYDLSSPPKIVEAGCYSLPEGDSALVLGTKDNLVYLLLRQYEDGRFVPFSLVVLDVSDVLRPLEITVHPLN